MRFGLPSETYLLKEPLPVYVTLGGVDWKLYVPNPGGHVVHCKLLKRGQRAGEAIFITAAGGDRLDHVLRVLGTEVRTDQPEIEIFRELLRQGRAELLPEPRSNVEFPFPE